LKRRLQNVRQQARGQMVDLTTLSKKDLISHGMSVGADVGDDVDVTKLTNAELRTRGVQLELPQVYGTDDPYDVAVWRYNLGEGAPLKARLAAGFGANPHDAAIKVLREKHGTDLRTRIGPSKRLEYKAHKKGRWTVFDPGGLDIGDFLEEGGEGLVVAADIVGSVGGAMIAGGSVGAVTKNPATAGWAMSAGEAGGSGVMTFIGEVIRQSIGVGLNVNDNDLEQIIDDAAIKAGIAAGTTSVAGGLFRLGKGTINIFMGRRFHATMDEMEMGTPDAKEVIAAINKGLRDFDVKYSPRASQTGANEARWLDEQYRDSIPYGHTKQYRDQDAKNIGALSEFYARMEGRFQSEITNPWDAGIAAQKAAAKYAPTKGARVDEIVGAGEEAVSAVGDPLKRSVAEIEAIGVEVREAAREAQDALRDTFTPLYQRYAEGEIGQLTLLSSTSPIHMLAKKFKAHEVSAIIEGWDRADALLLKRLLPGKPRSSFDIRFDVKPKDPQQKKVITLEEIQRTLKKLNQKLIPAEHGLTSSPADVQTLKEIKGALKATRADLLNQNKRQDLLEEIADLDVQLKLAKDVVDRSIIGDVMKLNNGKFMMKDEQVFDKVFTPGGIQNARRMAEVTTNNPQAKTAIREGFYAKYYDKVFIKEGPVSGVMLPDKKAHDRFIREYGEQMDLFFPGQTNQIQNIGGLAGVIKKQRKQRTDMLERINKMFSSQLQGFDPDTIIGFALNKQNSGKTMKLRVLLNGDPEALVAVQAGVARKIREAMIDPTNGEFSSARLGRLFTETGEANLRHMMGSKYVNDLKTLKGALDQMQKKSGLTGMLEENSNTFQNIFRWFVAPPLSPRGRGFSATQGWRRERAIEVLGDALVSETALKKLIESRFHKPMTRISIELAASIGALDLLAFPDVEQGVR